MGDTFLRLSQRRVIYSPARVGACWGPLRMRDHKQINNRARRIVHDTFTIPSKNFQDLRL
jgi:hypothetical protein